MPQGGEEIRAPATVVQGGTIQVQVGPSATSVQMSVGGANDTQSFKVPPSKTLSIPVPNVPPGTLVKLSVGRGLRRRLVFVEVIALSP